LLAVPGRLTRKDLFSSANVFLKRHRMDLICLLSARNRH
jgi:hypothetical protein